MTTSMPIASPDRAAPLPDVDAADVCVIIAAKDAPATIRRAVSSALRERRVAEIVVVDDGSADEKTAEAALSADDASGRLRVLRLPENRGPAHARNVAIQHSTAPLLAILDADDFFLAGRFDNLVAGDDWDFVADNIVFMDAGLADGAIEVEAFAPEPSYVALEEFIEGNISRPGADRGEIGFLKPVMRRAFLDTHKLRYREELRLGEDYDLYARALAQGARYKVVRRCGYGAVVRADSLSGKHRTLDLKRLYEADRAILATLALDVDEAAAFRRHERHIRSRYELRRFLDRKAEAGLWRAGIGAVSRPSALPAIVAGVASDKWRAFRKRRRGAPLQDALKPRYLLAGRLAQNRDTARS
jgi:succinoglycan biosynthesis protein ExoU